jgi:hypothetical protein
MKAMPFREQFVAGSGGRRVAGLLALANRECLREAEEELAHL